MCFIGNGRPNANGHGLGVNPGKKPEGSSGAVGNVDSPHKGKGRRVEKERVLTILRGEENAGGTPI